MARLLDRHNLFTGVVVEVFETHDTVSIKLAELTESLLFQFKPGQFINLGVEIDLLISSATLMGCFILSKLDQAGGFAPCSQVY